MAAPIELSLEVQGGPKPHVHPVKIYEDDEGLSKMVVTYLSEGLRQDETLLVVATPAHWDAFARGLRDLGFDPQERADAGQLTVLDAGGTLARLMTGELPNRARFEAVISQAMDAAMAWRPEAPLRAYGEMVDLLWQEGRLESALRLEECWQDLMKKRPFSLLCGYKVSVLDSPELAEAMEKICACHTALIPAFDPARLERAVDRAILTVIGESRAESLRPLMAGNVVLPGLGRAEKAILWVRRNLPEAANSVVEWARRFYDGEA